MSTSTELTPLENLASLEVKPFDEAVWQAWIAKGREQEKRSAAACMRALWIVIPVLIAAAGGWFYFAR